MKIDITAATQSVKDYLDGEINGLDLSKSLSHISGAADGLNKKQQVTFKYYVGFFEKEGKQLYLDSNKYLKEEVDELGDFVENLNTELMEQS